MQRGLGHNLVPETPLAPAGPVNPVRPCGPTGPIGPCGPLAPAGPTGPTGPAIPCAPCARPVQPFRSSGRNPRCADNRAILPAVSVGNTDLQIIRSGSKVIRQIGHNHRVRIAQ